MNLKNFILIFSALCLFGQSDAQAQSQKPQKELNIVNFDQDGRQVIRYSNAGDAIDAHDGEIALFDGVYYLYGTSYDCGFEWQNKNAAFCGFKVYTSTDLQNWTDRGALFNAQTELWQKRCNGNTYGCFRPHVIFNKKTKKYVLWINVYDNVSGYRVFTSTSPVGPFAEVAEPKVAVNSTAPAAGLNNGDHDTFVDDDGTAYIACTDWRKKGSIVIEKLSEDYLSGTGEVSLPVTEKTTEAPGLFKRDGIYYVVYSDPNCGYCSGTGASYKTAKSPMGPWSESRKISDNSCGGQPSFVSTFKLATGDVFVFGSDLWNNAAKNEALANYYWSPLTFNEDGSIKPLDCNKNYKVNSSAVSFVQPINDASYSYKSKSVIKKGEIHVGGFSFNQAGIVKSFDLPLYRNGTTDADLNISIYLADENDQPKGKAIYSSTIIGKTIGWSIKKQIVKPNIRVKGNVRYCVILSSETTTGNFGYAVRQNTDGLREVINISFQTNGTTLSPIF